MYRRESLEWDRFGWLEDEWSGASSAVAPSAAAATNICTAAACMGPYLWLQPRKHTNKQTNTSTTAIPALYLEKKKHYNISWQQKKKPALKHYKLQIIICHSSATTMTVCTHHPSQQPALTL